MANGSSTLSEASPRSRALSIRSSSLIIRRPDNDLPHSDDEPSPKSTPENIPKPVMLQPLTRQVSHDGLVTCVEKENDKKRPAFGSTSSCSIIVHHHSEYDKVISIEPNKSSNEDFGALAIPLQPNLLRNPTLYAQHVRSLRLEAELHPLRLILSRLMTNINFNRKDIFNVPVDAVSLGLTDYLDVVKQPMDLGTVKIKLHSVAYNSRLEVANDIRLCFRNAMTYNPPQNTIHIAAKQLLLYFEDQLSSFCPEIADYTLLQSTHEPDHAVLVNSNMSSPINSPISQHLQTLKNSRGDNDDDLLALPLASANTKKRKKRGSKTNTGHSCQWCNGNICSICEQGCLPLQPTLLICNGPHCIGAKIRKLATYFIAPDGSCQYCQRCYAGLPAVLPVSGKHEDWDFCRYKRDLLKRKNDEESVEHWLTCQNCNSAVHRMCAMHNPYVHSPDSFLCSNCHLPASHKSDAIPISPRESSNCNLSHMYTFLAGAEYPVPLSTFASRDDCHSNEIQSADALCENDVSRFIEYKVRQRMVSEDCPNAEKTIVVRIISECERNYAIPYVIRKHFRMQHSDATLPGIIPPSRISYRSKAITLFQKIDGLDVCIFCMYVQEYNGDGDEFDSVTDKLHASQEKRVYIAYIDSVEHFRPRSCRTAVYQEVLTSYLATARLRGYETAHIWACPPSRGNSFVFWNHPTAQRTPNIERLTSWYHTALSRAIDCGIVTDVMSLYESSFEEPLRRIEDLTRKECEGSDEMPCPPLLEGDFWIEEALRIHNITVSRLSKEKSVPVTESSVPSDESHDPCPAIQIAAMLREKIISHPLAKAFRRPVNAAAMKLNDYHVIISKPMDLGTVHSRCIVGEYLTLKDMVSDVNLVFSNAQKFNPSGHIVHMNAIELNSLFITELNKVTSSWLEPGNKSDLEHSWVVFSGVSMSLCTTLKYFDGLALVEGPAIMENLDEKVSSSLCSSSTLHSGDNTMLSDPSSNTCTSQSLSTSQHILVDCKCSAEAVRLRMVGGDTWLLEKKGVIPPNSTGSLKTSKRGRKCTTDSIDEPVPKRRRQSWLGEEVGAAVRKMRTSFFKCSLQCKPDDDASCKSFYDYIGDLKVVSESALHTARVADARHALLEFSQFRSLEFDTLRRAKYSSAILLHYLHNEGAPGLIPTCTSCGEDIEVLRWHRICKVTENRTNNVVSTTGRKPKSLPPFSLEELCSKCYSEHRSQHEFIPLQVSL